MSEHEKRCCVACKEAIHPEATTCPHCHSRQKRSATQTLTESLKWAGGIAALITLILSASELNKLVDVWLKNERVVDEYVAAARLLGQTGDHSNAQSLLQLANELDPASAELRDLRIDLAKKKIRTFYLLDRDGLYLAELKTVINNSGQEVLDFSYRNNSEQELKKLQLEELVPLFARGIVSAKEQEKASLQAHLAWIDLLRRFGPVEYDVEKRFLDALKLDSGNPYANAMYAAWVLSPRNKLKRTDTERVELARKHFDRALRNDAANDWITALWLEALTSAKGAAVEHELLKALQRVKDSGRPLYERGPAAAAMNLNFIYTVARGHPTDEKNEKKIQTLLSAFELPDLLNKINWLSELIYGCRPGPSCQPEVQDARLLYLTGRIYAAQGENEQALDLFRLAATPKYRSSLTAEAIMQQLEMTLSSLQVPARRVILLGSAKPPWQKQDLLIEYQGRRLPGEKELAQINSDLTEGEKVQVRILREGKYLDLTSEPLSRYSVTSYVIPEKLLQPGQAKELQHWLSHTTE